MRNGIAYNSTTTNHILCLYLTLLILILNVTSIWASATASPLINIYLKLSPKNNVQDYGNHFKQMLNHDKYLADYNLKPIFDNHPLHITLYLTQYPAKNVKPLTQYIKKLTQQFHAFTITAQQLIVTPSGYVMLQIKPQPYLQHLSDTVVRSVNHLRDHLASVPSWAAHNPQKLSSFKQYGSPNVFTNYAPHFTFLTPNKTYSGKKERKLNQRLEHAIAQFNQCYPASIKASISAIAIGLADEQGQIIQELASFEL
ncbi:DUF1045 domain-containing protein [Legionella sp. CNM-1927-20]|uniref:DUF1045 domain-containing protein n=1 Tax=Legionella sp. CNM-1927-20 TaxID=3422221 RepID=UPI00403AC519